MFINQCNPMFINQCRKKYIRGYTKEFMRVKKLFIFLTLVLLLSFFVRPVGQVAYANDNSTVGNHETDEQGIAGVTDENGSSELETETTGENGLNDANQTSINKEVTAGDDQGDSPGIDSVKKSSTDEAVLFQQSVIQNPSVEYVTHLQDLGWLPTSSKDGETAGAAGQGKQMEAIKISLRNSPYGNSGITYKTHVQDYGWMDTVSNGAISGTTGKSKRIEAISINLTGEIANHYDIYYRVYSEKNGWLGWAKNGAYAGTTGFSRHVEAIEIVLVEKGGQAPASTTKSFLSKPNVFYQSHVQDYGWMNLEKNGELSGTTGQSKQMEAIKINLDNTSTYSGNIVYSAHVEDYGWLAQVSNGNIAGTEGKKKQMEAIKINLTGEIANYFDIYYRVHVENIGWFDWAKNGQTAGTEGLAKQIESIEVVLVEKGDPAPGSTKLPGISKPNIIYESHVQDYGWMEAVSNGALSGTTGKNKRMEAISISLEGSASLGGISYSTHIQDYGWLSEVTNGDIGGTIGKSKRMEAIKINLTGEMANYFDVYYRTHIQDYGWLGWAKNGMVSGSVGKSKRIEAIQIKLVPKGKGEAVDQNKAAVQRKVVFLDPGHGGNDPGAVSGGARETDINLSVALKVRSILQSRGYTVYMSRETDVFIPLLQRSQMANNVDPDIFVSIHTNSTGDGPNTKMGIEAYYYKYFPEYQPKINGIMHNDPTRIAKSIQLANIIQQTMVAYTGAPDRGIAGETFSVVRETEVPATLLEIGFINNDQERRKLVTDAYQSTLARAIADGIDKYFSAN